MKFLYTCILSISLALFAQQNALGAETFKIGILDFQKCFDESNEGRRIFGDLRKKQEALQGKLTQKENELKSLQKELEKQSLMLNLDAKEDKQKEFERKKRELQYLFQDVNEEMNKAKRSAQKQIFDDLKGIIDKIAKEGGYEIILEATQSRVVFWSGKADITEEVIAEYNKLKP